MRTTIFDLDGTLINSAVDLHAALNRLMAARGLPPFNLAEATGMTGDGVDALVQRAFTARHGHASAADLAAFRADYGANAAVLTRPYDGVADVLTALRAAGWRIGVCTNKPQAPAMAILDALGLAPLIDSVTGGDGPRKPDPAHMLAAVAAAGGTPDRAVAIGDHANDMLAAQAAGMPAVFAAWGYGHPAMAGRFPAAMTIADVPDMVAALVR